MLHRFKVEATYETIVEVELTDAQLRAYDANEESDEVWEIEGTVMALLEGKITRGEIAPDSSCTELLVPLELKRGCRVKVEPNVFGRWKFTDKYLGKEGTIVRRSGINRSDETGYSQCWYVLFDGESKSTVVEESNLKKV